MVVDILEVLDSGVVEDRHLAADQHVEHVALGRHHPPNRQQVALEAKYLLKRLFAEALEDLLLDILNPLGKLVDHWEVVIH
jgi:hypothetical protein